MRVTLGPLANVGEEAGSLHGHGGGGGGGGLGKGGERGGGRRRGGREKGEVREVPPLVEGNGGAPREILARAVATWSNPNTAVTAHAAAAGISRATNSTFQICFQETSNSCNAEHLAEHVRIAKTQEAAQLMCLRMSFFYFF